MVLIPTMVTETDISMHYMVCMGKDPAVVSSTHVLDEVRLVDSAAAESTSLDSALSCVKNVKDSAVNYPKSKYVPCLRSGSYTDIGPRKSMQDEHIRIDDLSACLGSSSNFCSPSAFYAVFDGHGGCEAATYMKSNSMKLLFENTVLPEASEINDLILKQLENSHREAFLRADIAIASESSVSGYSGTTALTALVLGRHLMVANAGDCRAVLCRNGKAVELSQDHRPSNFLERKRVEASGGYILDKYLNGSLSVTRALGDWDMKLPLGSNSPLIAEPEIKRAILTEEDEFLIIACDGIWDVMSNQYAVSVVRQGLRRHNDPQQCARELALDAIRLNTTDNLTVIVVCLSSCKPCQPQTRRFRYFSLSEESRNKLRSLLGSN